MQQDIADWLTQWAARNLDFSKRPEQKSELTDKARQCVTDGEAAGFTIAQLKDAAGGDVEHYLLDANNAGHVAE
jgi:hypothetical protein